jgi:hypothetical protein
MLDAAQIDLVGGEPDVETTFHDEIADACRGDDLQGHRDAVNLQVALSWTLDGVQTPGWPGLVLLAALTLAALLAADRFARRLDLLGLGKEQAFAFGLDPARFMRMAVLARSRLRRDISGRMSQRRRRRPPRHWIIMTFGAQETAHHGSCHDAAKIGRL